MNASSQTRRNRSRPCRIIIVDDHAIMRDGLSALLGAEPGLAVVATARNGQEAIDVAGREKPDLILMDLSMPGMDGARAIREIKRRYPIVAVVVLTFHKEDLHIHAALESGADGYVLKDDGREELLSAIRNVSAGKKYLSPGICDRVMSRYLGTDSPPFQPEAPVWSLLTHRERDVLKLIAEGYKTREIADQLSLSVKTIEKHRANMMRKLDLHSVSEVTTYAISNGFLAQ